MRFGPFSLQFELPLFRAFEPPVRAPFTAGERRLVQLDQGIVAYTLKRSKRRSIGFVVRDEGLAVTAPQWISLSKIEDAIRAKKGWIFARLAEAQERRSRVCEVQWQDGGSLPYLGKLIHLAVEPHASAGGRRAPVRFDAETNLLHVRSPASPDSEHLKEPVRAWLHAEARRILAERLEVFSARIGARCTSFRLSSATTRWGSCSASGKILLNWRLIHLPLASIDYVVAHELAHLKEMNHGPRFWQLVAEALPGFEAEREYLKNPPSELLPRF